MYALSSMAKIMYVFIEFIFSFYPNSGKAFQQSLIPQHKLSRLTIVSREAKKKQHARASSGLRDHYSELFTRMAAL